MGDRCWADIWIRLDQEAAAVLILHHHGFYVTSRTVRGGFVHYAYDAMPYGCLDLSTALANSGIVHAGRHGNGEAYAGACFACDGERFVYVPMYDGDVDCVLLDMSTPERAEEHFSALVEKIALIRRVERWLEASPIEQLGVLT